MPLLSRSSRSFGKNTNSQITDVFAKNTIISISGDTPSISYNTDASVINNTITPVGQVRPTGLHPFAGDGYYSTLLNRFGGTLVAEPSVAFRFNTGDYTIETWYYFRGRANYTATIFNFRSGTDGLLFQIVGGKYTYSVNNLKSARF